MKIFEYFYEEYVLPVLERVSEFGVILGAAVLNTILVMFMWLSVPIWIIPFLVVKRRKDLVQAIRGAIRQVYKYHSAGSGLHIVIDDMNTETHYIKWCIKYSIPQIENEAERQACERCAELLLKVSKRDRDNIITDIWSMK